MLVNIGEKGTHRSSRNAEVIKARCRRVLTLGQSYDPHIMLGVPPTQACLALPKGSYNVPTFLTSLTCLL